MGPQSTAECFISLQGSQSVVLPRLRDSCMHGTGNFLYRFIFQLNIAAVGQILDGSRFSTDTFANTSWTVTSTISNLLLGERRINLPIHSSLRPIQFSISSKGPYQSISHLIISHVLGFYRDQ